jgi:hypothetical protein
MGKPPRWTEEQEGWVRENYPLLGPRPCLESEYAKRFQPPRTMRAIVSKAHAMGLHVKKTPNLTEAERVVRWMSEPEMDAWMRSHDVGQRRSTLAEGFEREFGFRITPQQVSAWRTWSGNITKRNSGGPQARWRHVPVGAERLTKDGWIVKVAGKPSKAGTKDNWKRRGVVRWEEVHGPLGKGMALMHADGDVENDDLANLVPCPRRLMGILNNGGATWSDADELRACIAMAELKEAIRTAECRTRTCGICGRPFEAPRSNPSAKTCPDCRKAGRKYMELKDHGRAVCKNCRRGFTKHQDNQIYCHECSKASWSKRKEIRHGLGLP